MSHCHTVLFEDSGLFNIWRNIFQTFDYSDNYLHVVNETSEMCLQELYEDIIKRFCRIANNQFRKVILTKICKTKTERLR